MAKKLIKEIECNVNLYINPKTGIAWVEDGSTGMIHSAHANIDSTGSIKGMKNLGYWGKKDRCIRSNGWIYNIDTIYARTEYEHIAKEYCQCGGKH
jgi:hypothetical protein